MAHSPMPAAMATKSAPSRSRRREKPSSGSSWLVCTVAASPVASTSAASANPHTQAATVRATDKRTRACGGAAAPASEAARPSRAVATKRSALTSPTGSAARR